MSSFKSERDALRILFTVDPEIPVPPIGYGGIERIVDGLINELRGLGHHVGLLAHRDSRCVVDWQGAWPGARSQSSMDTVQNLIALQRAVSAFRPALLHSFSRIAYFGPALLSSLPKIMSYQRDPSLRTTSIAAKMARGSLCFTGCSQYIADRGANAGGFWRGIPNFVDPTTMRFQSSVSSTAPLLFLSKLIPQKGCHWAIEIAKQSGRRLIIAGNRDETGSSQGYFGQEIAPHLGRDGIEFVGEVNDQQKSELLGSAQAMVVPIQWEEPFGIVFAESLACGTPVISCPRGAIPEIVQHGKHGFHIQSIEDGVDAVSRLGEISRAECRAQVMRNFTVSAVAQRYLSLYRHMLGLDDA